MSQWLPDRAVSPVHGCTLQRRPHALPGDRHLSTTRARSVEDLSMPAKEDVPRMSCRCGSVLQKNNKTAISLSTSLLTATTPTKDDSTVLFGRRVCRRMSRVARRIAYIIHMLVNSAGPLRSRQCGAPMFY